MSLKQAFWYIKKKFFLKSKTSLDFNHICRVSKSLFHRIACLLQLSVPISALGRDGDRTGVKTLVILYPGVNSLECEIFPSFVKIPEEWLFFFFYNKNNPLPPKNQREKSKAHFMLGWFSLIIWSLPLLGWEVIAAINICNSLSDVLYLLTLPQGRCCAWKNKNIEWWD